MSLGLSRQSSKTGATLTKMGERRTIADVFNNQAMIHYLDQRHVKKLKSNVRTKKLKRTLSKIPEKSSLLPLLRKGEDESFLMPREDFGYAKRKRKGKRGKKGKKKRSSKTVSTIKRAARNSLKKAKSILTNKRKNRRKNKKTGRKKN